MIRAVLFTTLLYLASPIVAPGAAAARLDYGLYVLGVPVADAWVTLDLSAATYRIAFQFQTIGVASLVKDDRLEEHTTGRLDNGGPAPEAYLSTGYIHGLDRVVGMNWRDGNPVVTTRNPPNRGERDDVPMALQAHTVDPLSAIVLLIHLVALTGRCEGNARTYDGRRLESFEVKTAGEEDVAPSIHSSFSGRGLRCDFTNQALAGFRLGSNRDDDLRQHRGTMWFSQVLPGAPRLPIRVSIETQFLGDAMVYLKAVTP